MPEAAIEQKTYNVRVELTAGGPIIWEDISSEQADRILTALANNKNYRTSTDVVMADKVVHVSKRVYKQPIPEPF